MSTNSFKTLSGSSSRDSNEILRVIFFRVPQCSGRMERRGFATGLVPDLRGVMAYRLYVRLFIYPYIYIYIYVCVSECCILKKSNVYSLHLKDLHVEATHDGCGSFSHLHDILVVHLFNAGFPCMASARTLDKTQPVANVTHWLPCEAVHSASNPSHRSYLLLLKLIGPYGLGAVCENM